MNPEPQPALALRAPPTSLAARAPRACVHCGQALAGATPGPFCCFGCRTVHNALVSAGLESFYALRGPAGEPVGELELERRDRAWLEPLARSIATAPEGTHLRLRVQGIRCAACVWVVQKLFARQAGAQQCVLNPTFGSLELNVGSEFDLARFVDEVERCGYRLGLDSQPAREQDTLLLRVGVTAALALNAMAFGAAIHLGIAPGPLQDLFQGLGYGAACLTVLVGAPVFFTSARAALARGILHLDVPIALGIALTFAATSGAYWSGHYNSAYFDSLAAFIALMLGGRWLQERAIARNRRELLDDASLDTLNARRIEPDGVTSTRYGALRRDDIVLLSPGDLVPVDAELLDARGSFSLDWISGESEPRVIERGKEVPAGAFNVGAGAVRARLVADFAASTLLPIVGAVPATGGREGGAAGRSVERLQSFSTRYVVGVVMLAVGGLVYHGILGGDWMLGLTVATAVCVVTCPCAVGIAVPLAYELAHAALRRRGLFVRSTSFLDRARRVRQVVFDKTGTLTTGKLHLLEPERVHALADAEQRVLYQLAVRSLHPRSIAIRRELDGLGERLRSELEVTEQPGLGLEASIDGHRYRLGRRPWALTDAAADDELVFAKDGALLATIPTADAERPGAASELAALRSRGLEVRVLSGDGAERVRATADRLGLPAAHALGGLSPTDKAVWLEANTADDALMIGDGINDAPAARKALCSGTCAVDRALLPARTDFYFTTAGLGPVGTALRAARDVGSVVRSTLGLALAYNAAAVAIALSGAMQPWLAAVLMPLSSVASVAYVSSALSRRSRAWKC